MAVTSQIKALVSLSGGMDSATVLAEAIKSERLCSAVSFNYDSKHNPYEIAMALELINHYNIPFRVIDLKEVMRGFKSNLMADGGDIPEGHYEEESMKKTVVPGRNIIFTSILSGLAWSLEAKEIWLGIHMGDFAIYPDCTMAFFEAMNNAIRVGTGGRVELVAPFIRTDKEGILKRGMELGVPYHLTRTCYKAQEKACGKCGSCTERLEAFQKLGWKDPVDYE